MKIKISLIILLLAAIVSVATAQKVVNIKPVSLTNALNNQPVSFADFQDAKGIAIIFTSNYCPYSKLYDSRINSLAAQYTAKGIQFVLVNSNHPSANNDDSMADMSKEGKRKNYSFPYLADKDHKLLVLLGATKTPEVFLLRPQGSNYLIIYSGAIDDNPQVSEDVTKQYLKDAMDALLSGKTPGVKNIRATGCMIKKK